MLQIDLHDLRYSDFRPTIQTFRPYVGRSSRPEWDAVGMIGQLVVIDDGTCEVNKYCRASDDPKISLS